jgi:hypothetical protein
MHKKILKHIFWSEENELLCEQNKQEEIDLIIVNK